MLKKLKSVLLAIVLILPLMVVFSGCKGDEGNNNQNNNQQTEQPTNPDPPTPVDGTYNLKLDYALPGRLSELYDNIDETKSTKTSFVLPSFTGTNLNDFFDGWYDRSNDTKIEKSWVLGTNGQTISVYGKWNEEILDYYYSDGLEISVNISSNYAYVSGYNDSSETIVLPKIFSYEDNDFLVNVISQNAFENSSVKKVIYLGDELEIEDEAFLNSSIESFDFSQVGVIGLNAFSNTNIKSAIFSNRLKSVSNNAFKNCANLESVDFVSCAADFSNIPSYAFADCTKLNLIKLSNYIKTIDTFAFNNCSSLLNLDFSEKNIVNIESEAFANCSNLKSLSLPESVSNVGTNAFNGIDNLETITLGNLFYDNNQTMLGVFGTSLSQIKNIILVGSKIESLNADYFSSCVALESFTMNNSIISVEQNAFANCTNLINITFSDAIQGEYFDSSAFFDTAWYKTKDQIIIKNNSVLIVPLGCPAELEASNFENATTIAINAFVQNNTVTKVTLPATLKFIGDRAFYKCTNLEEVIFENGSMLSSIGVEAFFDCRSLSKINLQVCTNLKLIGNRAFSKIGQVEIFNIPASIESFRIACFENSKIKTFNINGENSKYYTENGVIYEKLKSGKAIYAYPIGKQESAFLIDSNVKKIYESAFFGATLDYIYIASSTLIFAGDAYSRAFDNTLTKILIASSNVVLPINTYNWNVYYLLSDNYTYIEETNSIELTSSTLNKNGYYVSVEIDSIQHYYLLQLNSGNLTWQVEITSDVKDLIN